MNLDWGAVERGSEGTGVDMLMGSPRICRMVGRLGRRLRDPGRSRVEGP
jgi:hypothetical protein